MKLLLIAAFCLLSASAIAQPTNDFRVKTYAETWREKEHQRYNDAYIEGIRNQRNTPATSNRVDTKAIEQLVESWKRNTKKAGLTPEEEAAKERAERKARQEARQAKAEEERRRGLYLSKLDLEAETQHRQWAKTNYDDLKTIGFAEDDAEMLSDYYTPYATNGGGFANKVSGASLQEIREAAAALKAFYSKLPNASFDELLNLTYPLRKTVATFFKITDEMEKRWPNKRAELDKARLISACFLYDEWKVGNVKFNNQGFTTEINSSEIKKEFLPFFRAHIADDLPLVLYTLGETNGQFNSIMMLAFDHLKNKDTATARNLFKSCLFIPVAHVGDTTLMIYGEQHPAMKETFLRLGYNLRTDIPSFLDPGFVAAVATFQNVRMHNVLERWAGKQFEALSTQYARKVPYFRERPSLYPVEELLPVLKNAAEAGNADCENAYAIQLLGSKNDADKTQGLEYLKKAIAHGSVWARLNLALEASFNTPGAPDFESQKAALQSFAGSASKEQRVELANCLLKEELVLFIDPWFYTFSYDVIKRLANEGDTAFQEYLSKKGNVYRYGFYTGQVKDMDWDYAKYSGPVVNGRPHGVGTLTDAYGYRKGNFVLGTKKGKFTVKEKGEKQRTIEY